MRMAGAQDSLSLMALKGHILRQFRRTVGCVLSVLVSTCLWFLYVLRLLCYVWPHCHFTAGLSTALMGYNPAFFYVLCVYVYVCSCVYMHVLGGGVMVESDATINTTFFFIV